MRLAKGFFAVGASMSLNPHAKAFVGSSAGRHHSGRNEHDAKETCSRTIYCDLDGVLVDFDRGCVSVTGTTPDQLSKKTMWKGLGGARSFYENLEWMADGRDLWEGIVDLHPTILTGLPMGDWAEPQKRAWCKRELGENVPVITCMSRDKHLYCRPGSVLIDDRLSLREDWQRAGGKFIHHTSATSSLEKLKALLSADPL